jgi:Putative metallopeptidase
MKFNLLPCTFSSIKTVAIITSALLSFPANTLSAIAFDDELNSLNKQMIAQSSRLIKPKLKVQYKVSSDPQKNQYIESLRPSLDFLVNMLNSKIANRLPRDIPIIVGDCNTPNAFYSSENQSIVICSELMQEVKTVFETPSLKLPEQVNDITLNNSLRMMQETILGVFLHESGHMLVDQLKLPVLGKEEDAADVFSAYFILELMPKGVNNEIREGMVKSQAVFWLKSADIKTSNPNNLSYINQFFDEHSTDSQRGATFLCALASSPEYQKVISDATAPFDKNSSQSISKCNQRLYLLPKQSWNKLLFNSPKSPVRQSSPGGLG